MKARGGIFKIIDQPKKIGARGNDLDTEEIQDRMNIIDAEN